MNLIPFNQNLSEDVKDVLLDLQKFCKSLCVEGLCGFVFLRELLCVLSGRVFVRFAVKFKTLMTPLSGFQQSFVQLNKEAVNEFALSQKKFANKLNNFLLKENFEQKTQFLQQFVIWKVEVSL
jgi:hypothetical protein